MRRRAYHRTVPESVLPQPRRTVLSAWLPVLAWAGLIFALSSMPHLGTDLGTWDLVLRKLAHAAEYAVLGALLARAIGSLPVAALAGVAYAVTDEWHQTFVAGRDGSVRDVLVDAAGVVLGVALFRLATRRTVR
jgi:VanZ family protein